jgi:hypothetical protein
MFQYFPSSLGRSGHSKAAVAIDSTAVMPFIRPSMPYTGTHRVRIDMKCVVPHARMKATKSWMTHVYCRSLRLDAKAARASGIEKYAMPITASEIACR